MAKSDKTEEWAKTKEQIDNLFDLNNNLTMQILHRIWFRNILYYMGEQWFEWAKSDATFRRMMPNPNTPTPVSNIIRDYVRSMKALILNKDYTVTVWPNSNDQDDREAAEMGGILLRHLESVDDEAFMDEMEKTAIWTVVAGIAFDRTYPYMDDDKWLFDASGNPIKTGEVITESVNPFSVRVDNYGERFRRKRCVGVQSLKPREWVEDTFKILLGSSGSTENSQVVNYERKLSQLVANVSPWKGASVENMGQFPDDDLVLFREVEYRPTRNYPKGRYVGMCEDKKCFDLKRMPIKVEKDGTWEYSLTDYHYHYVPGRFWSDGGINDLISPQNTINQIDQDLEINRKGVGRPIVLLSSDLNMKKVTKYGQSVLVLKYDAFSSGGVQPKIERGTPLPGQVLNERDLHMNSAQDAAGDPKNVLRGNAPTSGASGIMVDILKDAAEQGHLPDVNRYYRAFKRTKRKQLLLVKELYTEERMIKIPDKGNRVKVTSFRGADLRNNTDVRLELSSGIASTRAGQSHMLLKLTESGFFNADSPLDPEYRQDLLRRLGLSGFRDKRNVDVERAQTENQRLGNMSADDMVDEQVEIPPTEEMPEGGVITIPVIEGLFLSVGDMTGEGEPIVISDDPLFKYDDHQVHYEIHRRFILSSEFRQLDPELRDVMIAHCDVHKGVIDLQAMDEARKMAEMQAAATPPEPGMEGGDGGAPTVDGVAGPPAG